MLHNTLMYVIHQIETSISSDVLGNKKLWIMKISHMFTTPKWIQVAFFHSIYFDIFIILKQWTQIESRANAPAASISQHRPRCFSVLRASIVSTVADQCSKDSERMLTQVMLKIYPLSTWRIEFNVKYVDKNIPSWIWIIFKMRNFIR